MDFAVFTSDLNEEGILIENTSAEMSLVAHQANAGKLGGRKPDKSRESPCPIKTQIPLDSLPAKVEEKDAKRNWLTGFTRKNGC